MNDLLIKGGTVLDPAQDVHGALDVAVTGDRITEVAPNLDPRQARRVVDVSGKMVVPGLIDMHTHCYGGYMRGGAPPDLVGIHSGVTTLVDAGSSGSSTYGGFPSFLVPHSTTRLYCFLHIARGGLTFIPEIRDAADINVEESLEALERHRGVFLGVKVRAVGPGVATLGLDMVRTAREVARRAGVRLMVHIGEPEPPQGVTLTRELLPLLERGDILTHVFTGHPGRVLDDRGKVLPQVWEAHQRGVTLDAAHGRANFGFEVARRALDQGLLPDVISTDISIPNRRRYVYSLTEMMSKFLALGMSFQDAVARCTINPARALGLDGELGSLAPGRVADITVLDVVSGDFLFEDTMGQHLRGSQAVVPAVTVRAGRVMPLDWGPHPWGWLPATREDKPH